MEEARKYTDDLLRWHPHVLAAGGSNRHKGRRKVGYKYQVKSHPHYSTWVFEDGRFTLEVDGIKETHAGPAAVTIHPQIQANIRFAAACRVKWFEWGITSREFVARKLSEGGLLYADYLRNEPSISPGEDRGWLVITGPFARRTFQSASYICSRWWRDLENWRAANASLAVWLSELLDEHNARKQKGESHWMWQARVKAGHMIENGLTVVAWARAMDMGERAFYNRVKSESGFAPSKIISEIRQIIAFKELDEGTKSMEEIAFRCGFSSVGSFSNWFTKAVGVAPTHWKRGERNY